MAITVYTWTVPPNDPPWMSSRAMRAAILPDQTDVNANIPVENDPTGSVIQDMIVEAYNRVVDPTPAVVLGDFDFVPPPQGYTWPVNSAD